LAVGFLYLHAEYNPATNCIAAGRHGDIYNFATANKMGLQRLSSAIAGVPLHGLASHAALPLPGEK
jgi:hypothetical protein